MADALPPQRELFAVPADVAYFNTATMAPQLHAVRAAGDEALRARGEPWNIQTADWFDDVERLRGLAGRLFSDDAEGVALIPATSYGFAVAARNLRGSVREQGPGPGRRVPVGHLHVAALR